MHNFFGWNAANFGWGGDTVQNILWRLTEGELDGVHPKVIVVMAGTNNVGGALRDGVDAAVVENVTNGMKAVLELMQRKAPDATVILMGITPRTDSRGRRERHADDRCDQRAVCAVRGRATRFAT